MKILGWYIDQNGVKTQKYPQISITYKTKKNVNSSQYTTK